LADRFDDNACVLLNNKGEMIGTRVNGVVAAELRDIQGGPAGSGGRWGKILGLAGKVCLIDGFRLLLFKTILIRLDH
jgi:ribosomal protein L14